MDSKVTQPKADDNITKERAGWNSKLFRADKTEEVRRDKVSFLCDVLPYYAPCLMVLVQMGLYQWCKGNLLVAIFIGMLSNFPYWRKELRAHETEQNLDRQSEKVWKEDKRFMGPLYTYVTLDTLTWVWCLCVISGVYPQWAAPFCQDKISNTFGGYFCFVFVWGYTAGVNGLAGHELIHRKSAFDKAMGMSTFSKIWYSHFLLEHSSGHHRSVATLEDPATSRLGENFYTFAFRSSIGGHVNTYQREVSRLQMKYVVEQVPLKTQLLENRMSWFLALHLLMAGVISCVFGTRALVFQVCYSVVGVFFIELINYTEHYGLLRKKDVRGIYEPITEQHSWNAPSSELLFRIQRHSDHHMHAYRPYQILRKIDAAPMMPYAYLYTLTLALCPPLWQSTMGDLLQNRNCISNEWRNKWYFVGVLAFMAYSVFTFI